MPWIKVDSSQSGSPAAQDGRADAQSPAGSNLAGT